MIDRRTVVAALAGLPVLGAAACSTTPPASEAKPRLRMIKSNGINMRIAEMGAGGKEKPLVILVHGWPESWYSWRNQLPALAAAGYHVVAPDMRGYGKTDKPQAVEDYDIHNLSGDLVGIVDALGYTSAILVAHDWGAIVSWNTMLLHPTRFTALAAMSVPYNGRAARPPIESMRAANGENFYYIVYFQDYGVAEKEFDADPRGMLSRIYVSPDTPKEPPAITDPRASAGGWIARRGLPTQSPPWLTKADLDYYVKEFTEAGFRGGINYYRNFDRNWQTTPQLAGVKVSQPVMFLAGAEDSVIRGATAASLETSLKRNVNDLRGVTLYPGAGHWIQQERAADVNAALLAFLANLKTA